MKYLRLYNFIADAIRILAIQEEEVYKKYKALSVSKKKEINQKLVQTATFRGQQGRISRPVKAILSGRL